MTESRGGCGIRLFDIWPVFTFQAVKDGTGVAIFLAEALFEHTHEKVFRQSLKVVRIEFRLFFFALLLSLLTLLLLGKKHIILSLAFLEVFRCLFGKLRATFEAPVLKLIESYDDSLMLLGEIVSKGCLTALFRADDNDVAFVFFLDSGWVLDL